MNTSSSNCRVEVFKQDLIDAISPDGGQPSRMANDHLETCDELMSDFTVGLVYNDYGYFLVTDICLLSPPLPQGTSMQTACTAYVNIAQCQLGNEY
jgi:hypothetical protein